MIRITRIFIILIILLNMGCKKKKQKSIAQSKVSVFVSILPQKYFVEKIGKDKINVQVMVGPGYSPATYEPTSKQMSALNKAKLFFSIGVPFEKAWLSKIQKSHKNLKIVSTIKDIPLRKMDNIHEILKKHHHKKKKHHEHSHHKKEKHHHKHDHSGHDPHTWLSPLLVKIQAQNICAALIKADPKNKAFFEKNLQEFHKELNLLYQDIKESLSKLKVKRFLTFHPAWGYFGQAFGLKQIPIEIEGKSPSAKELTRIIQLVKKEGLKVIFVQKQFSTKLARAIAQNTGGKVVHLDPLAYDYSANLRKIAKKIKAELK